MPYIDEVSRERVDRLREPDTVGELNYALTITCRGFIERNGGLRYSTINAAIGALECAKLELYRRLAVPYENQKIEENGDIEFYKENNGKV